LNNLHNPLVRQCTVSYNATLVDRRLYLPKLGRIMLGLRQRIKNYSKLVRKCFVREISASKVTRYHFFLTKVLS